jgi:hypothetical protein
MLLYNNGAGGVVVGANSFKYYNGTSLVGNFSSTGLAVTGTLSATGDISLATTKQLGWGASPFTCAIEGASGASGYIRLFTNNAERARIDSSGNLGIGTNSPSFKLDVNGTGYVRDWLYLYGSNTKGITSDGSSHPIIFGINAVEKMRLDSSGNLLVGVTSNPGGSYGSESLVVSGGSNTVLFLTTATASSGVAATTARSSSGFQHAFFQSGTKLGDISTNGSATSYNTASDYRLKENVQPMIGALAKVALLKPCTYKWKSDGSDGEGFIAHELSEVVPQCVTGEKDAVDEEGNPNNQGIDTSFLVATLTAALQEAHGLIKDLTTRITALEAK